MKKIFNLILAALVIIGAAACTKNEEVVNEPQVESLSFYAEVVNGDTRAYIDDADGDKVWNTIWEEGDAVYVGADNADPYIFNYANGKFTCSEQGVTSLIGQSVIVAPYQVNNDSTAGKSAWSFTGTRVENFDADVKVQLTADTSFFRYTYNGTGEVTITVAPANNITKVFRYCEEEDKFDYFSSIALKGAATDKFVGFWPQTLSGLEATLSYSINGVKCKETSITLATGKVYNLGTLEAKKNEVFLVPGVWASDGARFAVYETATDTWTNMTPVTGEFGLYSAEVSSSKIIFARMNPSTSENKWDNKWNQTADLDVPTDDNNCYYITDWEKGEWRAYTPIEWAIAGTFLDTNWNKEEKMSKVSDSVYSLKNQTLKAYDEFKVKVFGDKDWKTSFGPTSFSFFTPGHWQTAGLNASGNFSVDSAGTYDFYLDVANTRIYVVNAGSDYTAATEQKTEGQAPEQEENAKKLYLKPNSNWTQANARFAAYFFGNGDRWVSMTDSDSDGIYEVAIPTDKSFPNIIFCRMNPSATANNWSNKWNQTGDLTIPTDGKNLYTINNGSWDAGSWSTKK